MPEGDTIHRLAARIDAATGGLTVVGFQTTEPHLRRDDVVGRKIETARAVGKNLIISLSPDLSLWSHLQMRGKWHVERPARSAPLERCGSRVHGEYRPAQLRLITEHASLLALDLRILRWLPSRDTKKAIEDRLGPDLLADDFDVEEARERLRERAQLPIGEALMRQDRLSGIGNVYKSEILFLERVHPQTPVSALADEALRRLVGRGRSLLKKNLGPGPRRTRFGTSGPRLWVYERAGERCLECGERIVMVRLGPKLRSSYFCPNCQKDQ